MVYEKMLTPCKVIHLKKRAICTGGYIIIQLHTAEQAKSRGSEYS